MKNSLYIPKGYEVERDCACGLNYLLDPIPDAILGLSIKEACCIHDWMYGIVSTEAYRKFADRIFLDNVLAIIDRDTNWSLLRWLRKLVAYGYYQGLKVVGWPIYHRKKSEEAERADRSA